MIIGDVLTVFGLGGAVQASPTDEAARIRLPAAAGLFYPDEELALANTVHSLLETAPANSTATLRALVVPHAGYAYSGPTAAHAYKLLVGREFETVIILGPSHYADFQGVSVPTAAKYRTPLGDVPISPKAPTLARRSPFVLEPRCRVQRPGWWRRSRKPAPADGEETPETWEHSVEVQLPFLQTTLKHFTVLPLLFGDVNPADAASGLLPILDGKTLLVVSTDLSHYHPYAEARRLDGDCLDAICALDSDRVKSQEACGKTPVLTLLHLARQCGWQAQALDYRNSGDTSGDQSAVVGYGAIAFFASPTRDELPAFFPTEKHLLLEIARGAVRAAAGAAALPEINPDALPKSLRKPGACFVTLRKSGALRGCIGNIQSQDPLYQAVLQNARSSALRDSRFAPVEAGELDDIRIEISVLTEPRRLLFDSAEELLRQLHQNQDGVVLKLGCHSSTFLPQVWEQVSSKEEFLDKLAQKAGYAPSAWRGPNVCVSTYQVDAFTESK